MGTPEFWVLVAFVIFLGLLVYLGVPGKILHALDNRAVKIRAELDEARSLREEASRLLADFARRREEAEREAETLVANARIEAERVAAEAKLAAEQFVARRTAMAEQKIAQAEAQAVADVRAAAADAAVSAAAKVLSGQSQGGPLGDQLFDNGLSEVRAKLN